MSGYTVCLGGSRPARGARRPAREARRGVQGPTPARRNLRWLAATSPSGGPRGAPGEKASETPGPGEKSSGAGGALVDPRRALGAPMDPCGGRRPVEKSAYFPNTCAGGGPVGVAGGGASSRGVAELGWVPPNRVPGAPRGPLGSLWGIPAAPRRPYGIPGNSCQATLYASAVQGRLGQGWRSEILHFNSFFTPRAAS